jgi:predicted outer membrane repeat protein
MMRSIAKWFGNRSKKKSDRTLVRNVSAKPRFETLEDREVPAVFNVNSVADVLHPPRGVMTLREAIELANATPGNNIINLNVGGTYKIASPNDGMNDNLSGAFTIIPNPNSPAGSTLTIRNTSGRQVIVDGNHLDRVFDINPQDVTAPTKFTVLLEGFTIQHGIAMPGDGAAGSGGGIRDQGNVSLTLFDMTVRGNRATADGGGISMENASSTPWTLTVTASTIADNHAGDAGGGIDTDGSGKVMVNGGTVITGNTTVNQGAGIWLDAIQVGDVFQSANLTVNHATVTNNGAISTGGIGGGIGNAGNGAVLIYNTTLSGNFAGATGGGFGDENAQGTLTVYNSTFLNNYAVGNGGGIAAGGPDTSITKSLFQTNTTGAAGGGLFANGVTLNVMNTGFLDNTSAGNGGAIELETTGTGSTITGTTIQGNSALNNGGANGGGIDAPTTFTGSVLLTGDAITANFSSDGGGIFWAAATGSTFSLQNTNVSGNFATTMPDVDPSMGTFTDLGGNILVG